MCVSVFGLNSIELPLPVFFSAYQNRISGNIPSEIARLTNLGKQQTHTKEIVSRQMSLS